MKMFTIKVGLAISLAALSPLVFAQAPTPFSGGQPPVLGQGSSLPYAKDHIVVRFKLGTSDATIKSVLGSYGLSLKVAGSSKYFVLAEIPSGLLQFGVTPISMARKVGMDPKVVWAEIDPVLTRDYIPNDPSFDQIYGLNNTGQSGGTNDADVDAPEAWDKASSFHDIVVAICDDGFDLGHEDLQDNLYVNLAEIPGNGLDDDGNGFIDDVNGWDFSDDDNNPSPAPGDYHGVHVSGTVAATFDNGVGVTGVGMNNIKYMPLRMYGGSNGFMSSLANAVDYAWENGAKVISVSYNIDGFTNALADAVGRARAADVVYVNSAGNNGQQNPPRQQLRQMYDNVIFVVASDRTDHKASFSNWGTLCEISAAGVNVLSTLPGNSYGLLSGTSMSTPLVAGVVGMIRSTDSGLTARQTLDRLLDAADSVSTLSSFVPGGKRANLNNALQAAIPPASLTISTVMGTHVAGDNGSIVDEDGNLYSIESEYLVNSGQYTCAEIVAEADGFTSDNARQISVTVTSRSSSDPTVQYLYLYNFASGKFEMLSSTRLSTVLMNQSLEVKRGAKNYVDPETGQVVIRVLGLQSYRRRGLAPIAFSHHTDKVEVSFVAG